MVCLAATPLGVASKVDLKAHNLVRGSNFETNPRLFSEFSVAISLNRDPHVKLTRKEPLEHSGELAKHRPAKQLSWPLVWFFPKVEQLPQLLPGTTPLESLRRWFKRGGVRGHCCRNL